MLVAEQEFGHLDAIGRFVQVAAVAPGLQFLESLFCLLVLYCHPLPLSIPHLSLR